MKFKKTYIIAEVGPNHNGSIQLAKKYIKLLSNCGADAIKFQLSEPKLALSRDAFPAKYEKTSKGFQKNEDIFETVKKRQISKLNHKRLLKLCKKFKVDYLCSAFDLQSLKFLNENLNLKYFKIPSGEILSLDMLKYINKQKKGVILSTGMATFKEIDFSLSNLRSIKNKLVLLHCISNYPTRSEDVNLLVMQNLKKKFNCEIGFSDHTLSDLASIVAVSLGAKVIEKHVTLNKKMQGPDHKNSMSISEFKTMVKKIREVEKILGQKNKIISKKELDIAKVARKSIISKFDLIPGTKLTKKNICFKRPGTGIFPTELKYLLNRKVKNFIEKDRVILKKNLKR